MLSHRKVARMSCITGHRVDITVVAAEASGSWKGGKKSQMEDKRDGWDRDGGDRDGGG